MMSTILSMFGNIFDTVADSLTSIFGAMGGSVALILSAFLMITVTRLLLRPLIGHAGSDIVRARSNYKYQQENK